MRANVLMVLGTSSSAGKSLLVTALCHIFARRGVRVAPFKAQNMSNNAAVCKDGSEIGRAQAVQAAAAGLDPTVEMNPILIKPEADAHSQIVVMGKPWQSLPAIDYYQKKAYLWQVITAALDRLRDQFDLIIMEGAGSPVELNLKPGDLVNMAVAQYAQSPVLLVGDIDRGGIFAQLLGTLWLLPPEEQALVRGLVVNKFRGDINLFTDGIQILEEKGKVPVLGVLPYLHGLHIPDEDAVSLENLTPVQMQPPNSENIDIVIIHLPRISNFDDFDMLLAEPGVHVRYVRSPDMLGQPDAIILPGTKSTIADLKWLQTAGLMLPITRFAHQGGAVVGICGGYQMLGKRVYDVEGVEGDSSTAVGLGLLSTITHFERIKATHQAVATIGRDAPAWLQPIRGDRVSGYEIHMGRTHSDMTWLTITERNGRSVSLPDGGISENGRVWGCYLHGLFGNQNIRHAWLKSLGWQGASTPYQTDPFSVSLTRLANKVESAFDMAQLERMIWGN